MDHVFDLDAIKNKLDDTDAYWKSFIEKSDFEIGILNLKPGKEDTQTPHNADEIYFIIEGDGFMDIGDKTFPIKPKTALYVPRNTKHKIYGNTKSVIAYYVLN